MRKRPVYTKIQKTTPMAKQLRAKQKALRQKSNPNAQRLASLKALREG